MTSGLGHETDVLRVLVADGRRNVRSALRLMLEQDPGIVVSAEASNSAEVMMQVERTRPDVIILDCDLPGLEATELLPAVRTISPGIRIVAMCARPELKQSALSAGADAFVGKTEPPQRLLGIVRQGSSGRGTRGTQPSDHQVGGGGATTEFPHAWTATKRLPRSAEVYAQPGEQHTYRTGRQWWSTAPEGCLWRISRARRGEPPISCCGTGPAAFFSIALKPCWT